MSKLVTIRSAAEYPQELEEIAKILYGTDARIFSFWRKNPEELAKLLVPYMRQRGFVFGQDNIYIAREDNETVGVTVGIISAVIKRDLSYPAGSGVFSLTDLADVDPRTKTICDQYLGRIYESVLGYPDDVAYIAALCVKEGHRRQGIGTRLLKNCIFRLQQDGIKTICLDCLEDNEAARKLYEAHGFELVNTGIGFDGSEDRNDSQVKTCTYALCM